MHENNVMMEMCLTQMDVMQAVRKRSVEMEQ